MLTLSIFLLAFATAAAQDKPNVLIFVADDLGWADAGFHGGDIETPSLDRLAQEGVELSRFYTTPICSPTRAALMTGRDPIRLGIAYSVILPWDNIGVNPVEHMMPESFKEAGYQTAMIGKWHLGHAQMTYHPNERGFDHFYGHLHTEVGYYPPFSMVGGKDFQRNGVSIDDDGYETFLLANEASRYIKERDTSKPFFMYVPFIAPHTPLDAPDDLKRKYKNINTNLPPARSSMTDATRQLAKKHGTPSARPLYAAVVDGMDQAIGQVLKTLEDEGLAENTIVLFFSDNGGAAYSYGGANNAPLRGGKGETFEGGIRVNSLIRFPKALNNGSKLNQIMTVMDVFPTLAAACGIETKNDLKLDGRNMWPAITEDKKVSLEDDIYFVSEIPIYGSIMATVFNEKWKLVQEIDQDQLEIKVKNYLFKISEDPYEKNNLADQYPDIVAGMQEKIVKRRALYPINGTRMQLVPPPGWRAPKDWATYPRPLDELQPEANKGVAPDEQTLRDLDQQHGERGRLIYDHRKK